MQIEVKLELTDQKKSINQPINESIFQSTLLCCFAVCYQLEEKNVQFVIGPEWSDAVKAVSYILEGVNVPQIAPFATNPTLSLAVEDFPYLMKVSPPRKFDVLIQASI